ncbi:MFS general substrate transporter [Obba rivulosa]|uniref:MFS general substrate transporter n=1 Tax=Obba rivulosa TaxID=1052685 RepID=A0A8E2DV93_9APHY|nr:MFS general substrate transporter [Obba rivulosa]
MAVIVEELRVEPDPCIRGPSLSGSLAQFREIRVSLNFRKVPNYVWSALFTFTGGFIFDFYTGSIGPITVMSQFQSQSSSGIISPIVQGLIVSSILLTAAMASLVTGPLADRISRTRVMTLGGLVFVVGSTLACSATSLSQLFVGRCIAGIVEGLFLSAVILYAVEIAPASARGRLGPMVQLLCTVGIVTVHIPPSLSWRSPFGIQAVVSVIFAIGCLFLPYFPRAKAEATWARLGVSAADAQQAKESAQREELWKKGLRTRTALGVFLMGMQQASGIDGVLYVNMQYAPVFFSQAGLSQNSASFIASGVSGLINVACTLVVQFFADKCTFLYSSSLVALIVWSSEGRRSSVTLGGEVIGLSMLLNGTLYASHAFDKPAGYRAIVIRIICTFEIQPTRTRAAATSPGRCANWVYNRLIAFSTPLFLAHSSCYSLLTTVVRLAFQPETKGVSLEDVDKTFEVPPWQIALRKRRDRERGQEILDDTQGVDYILPEVRYWSLITMHID